MNDSLGDRMKRYESANAQVLPRRMPVIMRLDGRAFHTLTRGLKSFDRDVHGAMIAAAKEVCKEAQGSQIAYTQSDEISILLHDYKTLASEPWFGNGVQKMCSVGASVCSVMFSRMIGKPAHFDARVFVLPEAEVNNYFVWRQQDCIRNSVQTWARAHFSHKQCERKSCEDLKAMLVHNHTPWAAIPDWCRMGSVVGVRVMPMAAPSFTGNTNVIDKFLKVDSWKK